MNPLSYLLSYRVARPVLGIPRVQPDTGSWLGPVRTRRTQQTVPHPSAGCTAPRAGSLVCLRRSLESRGIAITTGVVGEARVSQRITPRAEPGPGGGRARGGAMRRSEALPSLSDGAFRSSRFIPPWSLRRGGLHLLLGKEAFRGASHGNNS
ncbi:hypothetical protein NDU88_005734 [Pleurodeles waltl]|uniref:Uncharacterized protein n=1 Tax=Pleurodeles waltl TaxID=8319 RepID=A0AAV7L4Y5_PLEWA|nr:hypothetical protein NDU88_005734 [Pleurodeles waltl]